MERILGKLEIRAPESICEQIQGFLAREAPFGWEEEEQATGIVFRLHCEKKDFLTALAEKASRLFPQADFISTEIREQNWREAWKKFFTPVPCGKRFVVLPPWHDGTGFGDRTKVFIEPKSAFGTGHHATTALCLAALDMLLENGAVQSGQTFLDLGCGSGVLGIAAAKSGLNGIGLDTDSLAVDNSLENICLNNIESMEAETGSVEKAAGKSFDLIMANILAGPLIELAPDIVRLLARNGCLVLSGILATQADDVEKACMREGLGKAERLIDGEWVALVWQGQGNANSAVLGR